MVRLSDRHDTREKGPSQSFLVIGAGGFGGEAVRQQGRNLRHCPVPNMNLLGIDTTRDDIDRLGRAGIDTILLNPSGDAQRLGADRLSSIFRWPNIFDPPDRLFSRFVAEIGPQVLASLSIAAGAATRPAYGEVLARACIWTLCQQLRNHIEAALGASDLLQIVLTGSGGGGTSAALLLILARLVGTPEGLSLCSFQSPHRVLKPWTVTMPPYLQASLGENQVYAARPMANAYMFQKELDVLASQGIVKYAVKLGLQNGAGVAFRSLEAAARALADIVEGMIVAHSCTAANFINTIDPIINEGRRGLNVN